MQTSDYKQLKVWQKAMNLTMEIYRLVKFLPREETYALSDQLRRAVVSIPSNIAEGHGRGTDKEFIKFLWIARGSLLEVETQLIICNRLTLIKVEESKFAQSLIVEVGKMLNALITYR
ncbi:four helix bundle protein, partial [uncultured Muribaculum sp.]